MLVGEKEHALPEGERTCPACGNELQEMAGQSEDSEEVTVVERRFILVQHRRKKYRCACNGHVATAPAPGRLSLFEDGRSGRYSLDFAVEVAIDKYLDHMPLERQVRKIGREGLAIDSQTLWNQIEALARRLAPAHEALGVRVLAQQWNPEKSRSNLAKHGVRFSDAASVLEDPLARTARDLGVWSEDRLVTLGVDLMGRILVVVHVERGDRIRLISARLATTRERQQYQEGEGRS